MAELPSLRVRFVGRFTVGRSLASVVVGRADKGQCVHVRTQHADAGMKLVAGWEMKRMQILTRSLLHLKWTSWALGKLVRD